MTSFILFPMDTEIQGKSAVDPFTECTANLDVLRNGVCLCSIRHMNTTLTDTV